MNPVLRPIVVCGPSGSGKSTLLRKLIDEFEDYLGFTVSRKLFALKLVPAINKRES